MSYTALVQSQQEFFSSGQTLPYQFRRKQLLLLKQALQQYESQILQALERDLSKPAFESYASEIGFLHEEVNHALKHLKKWMKPNKVKTPLTSWPSSSYIRNEPKGVTLLIGPWNYPFQLVISPLVAAISAGNTAIIKPPEQTPAVADIVEEIISKTFPSEYIAVVQGLGHEVVPELMNNHRFDHVFFTGSTEVGRKVAELAAPKLTPVTLELGGKSPCIVDQSANLKIAARRIAFGKWLNAGQTCVAPDYLLLEDSIAEDFTRELESVLEDFYPKGALGSDDYTAIIHQDHFDKLKGYLNEGRVIYGGKYKEQELRMEPTLITDVSSEDQLMQEEIFGPVLPILRWKSTDEVFKTISRNPYPLSFYIFSDDRNRQKLFTERIQFGGGAINNSIVHLSNPNLPFGGIGTSGFGNYHGEFGFKTFSHEKAIMKTATWFDFKSKYPPYSGFAYKLIKRLMK